MEGGAVGHNFERDPPRNHPCQVRFNLVDSFRGEDWMDGRTPDAK